MLTLSRYALILLLGLLCLIGSARDGVAAGMREQLCNVNAEWLRYPDAGFAVGDWRPTGEVDLVRTHLAQVERLLRSRDVAELSPTLRRARLQNLDILHGYLEAGNFPINYFHTRRIPVFIDPHGTACAVGYLMIQGGERAFAEEVRRIDNNVYIRDIRDARFDAWAAGSGLTLDELALIQPSYGAYRWDYEEMGINSRIHAMVGEPGSDRLYVGGSFDVVGAANGLNNIAIRDGDRWSGLGEGVQGTVHAMAFYGNDLYVGGKFSTAGGAAANIARWNGETWEALGAGVDDTVTVLMEHDGMLYVGGAFSSADQGSPFLRAWDGQAWHNVAPYLDGTVRAMARHQNDLYVGGAFVHAGDVRVNHIARRAGQGWESLESGTDASVNSIISVGGSYLYASGPLHSLSGDTSFGLVQWNGTSWQFPELGMGYPYEPEGIREIVLWGGEGGANPSEPYMTLVRDSSTTFSRLGMSLGTVLANVLPDRVNAVCLADKKLYVGGRFAGLASVDLAQSGVDEPRASSGAALRTYPNPARATLTFVPTGIGGDKAYTLMMTDALGRQVLATHGTIGSGITVHTDELARGVYWYRIAIQGENDRVGVVTLE